MSFVYCQECGFQNPETANYCSRCGALLEKGETGSETTQTFTPDEVGELATDHPVEGLEGPALVVRSGGRSVLDHIDVDRLTDILSGKSTPEG